jgi:hypothetical protein
MAQGGVYADLYNTQFATQTRSEADGASLAPLS